MTYVVGLTGGIACGKSTVADGLVSRGATLIDADKVAREVVEPGTAGLAAVVEMFGADVVDDAGQLRRAALARIVFADPDQLARLNSLLHPRIEARIVGGLQAARDRGDAIVVIDAALLVEIGLAARCDGVVVVHCPAEIQVARLVARNGLTESEARARIASQASHEERLAHADHAIDNSAGLAELHAQIDDVWRALQAEAADQPSTSA